MSPPQAWLRGFRDGAADHERPGTGAAGIDTQQINTAFERMQKGDVRYRFVIDMKSLQKTDQHPS
jgi:hypothetical protein